MKSSEPDPHELANFHSRVYLQQPLLVFPTVSRPQPHCLSEYANSMAKRGILSDERADAQQVTKQLAHDRMSNADEQPRHGRPRNSRWKTACRTSQGECQPASKSQPNMWETGSIDSIKAVTCKKS